MSSPSRPASHALMSAATSLRLMSVQQRLSRFSFFSIGASANCGGSAGRCANVHLPRLTSYSSGTAIRAGDPPPRKARTCRSRSDRHRRETAEGARDVGGDGRFLGDDECLGQSDGPGERGRRYYPSFPQRRIEGRRRRCQRPPATGPTAPAISSSVSSASTASGGMPVRSTSVSRPTGSSPSALSSNPSVRPGRRAGGFPGRRRQAEFDQDVLRGLDQLRHLRGSARGSPGRAANGSIRESQKRPGRIPPRAAR